MNLNTPILECVPNFSEGRDEHVIRKIVASIQNIKTVKVLHVDMGFAANRTVVTFAGEANAVIDAAYEAVKTAAENIDMTRHSGVHPRIGATDVLPLVPISGIGIDETVKWSYLLADRIGNELNIPIYCYEKSALKPEREKLEWIRKGEYEGLVSKMLDPQWEPDFGPSSFNSKAGATILGARTFLIAYNITLNSQSVEIAKAIAADIRESGKIITDANGNKIKVPGLFTHLKAIGWYINEYQKAQVSMNITDFEKTPISEVFETVKKIASSYNITISGSELIGLLPLKAIMAAADFYVRQYSNLKSLSEEQCIQLAVDKLGFNDIKPFIPAERIIEYLLV